MFIQTLMDWVTSLVRSFTKPQTYGSSLEAYIVSKNPQNSYDVDAAVREYDNRNSGGFLC